VQGVVQFLESDDQDSSLRIRGVTVEQLPDQSVDATFH
jgi:hypothetical protein